MAELKPCKCGGRPKFERFCGWWHIECKKCGEYPVEYFGVSRVWGWNTKREAVAAWNRRADNGK